MAKRPKISERLRAAIEKCPDSYSELERITGVSPSIISRFVKHGSNMEINNVDRLAAHLGLELVASKAKVKR